MALGPALAGIGIRVPACGIIVEAVRVWLRAEVALNRSTVTTNMRPGVVVGKGSVCDKK
jgi:hypothetical protein